MLLFYYLFHIHYVLILIIVLSVQVYPPEAKDFVHITDNAYTRQEMLAMESDILNALNYEILVPTGFNFLSRYLNCIRASDSTRMLASYYAERNLQVCFELWSLCLRMMIVRAVNLLVFCEGSVIFSCNLFLLFLIFHRSRTCWK